MKPSHWITAVAFAITAMTAIGTFAQAIRETPLVANPYRNIGGSCVYGGKGELLHAPSGKSCVDRTAQAFPESAHGRTANAGAEVAGLLDTHEHFAKDVLAVQQAIEAGEKQRALDALDHLSAGLIQHWAREGELLKSVDAQPATQQR